MRSIFAMLLASAMAGGVWFVCPEAVREDVAATLTSGDEVLAGINQGVDNFLRSLDGPPGEINPERPAA